MNNDNWGKLNSETVMNSLRRIKLRHLETFVEVARQKSVSRAAENLHLTQPAVTRTIRELEDICGKPLVERSRDVAEAIVLSVEARSPAFTLTADAVFADALFFNDSGYSVSAVGIPLSGSILIRPLAATFTRRCSLVAA